jgi:hypothetical protein
MFVFIFPLIFIISPFFTIQGMSKNLVPYFIEEKLCSKASNCIDVGTEN